MPSTPPLMLRNRFALCVAMLALSLGSTIRAADEKPHAFEKDIQKFEAMDAESPPPANSILFVGSSSIRMWDLKKSFPDLPVLNRGFGGSKIEDSNYFFDRVVLKYQPRLIVFYAGDNDLARGDKTPEAVFEDFKTFVGKAHASLPETPVLYISIKPSIARWRLIDSGRKANGLIEEFSKSDPLVKFVNVEPVMIGEDGKPRSELFLDDGLHLNTRGYEEWTALVLPLLK